MKLLSAAELSEVAKALAADQFCPAASEICWDHLSLLTPPENISTTECATLYRKIRTAEGTGYNLWSRDLTPYIVGPQDALDNPNVAEVIIPKPGRSGGTVAFENYLFKLARFGPMPDVGWYLGGPDEVKSYCDKQVTALFEDHPEIASKIGTGKSDNNITRKKVAGRQLEYLAASNKTLTNRQFGFMVGDEIDTFTPRMRASFLQQTRIRGRMLGKRRKVGMASHPDAGWTTGIASAWVDSSRGIYVWACPDCQKWSSPWPTKYWPDVPRAALWYLKLPDADRDERVAKAVETAAMQCPHCGSLLSDEQRHAMSRAGKWLHRGQEFDVEIGPVGEPDENSAMGFWIHGLMVLTITHAELAKELETATIQFERTRKVDQLREVLAKVFGQVFEGAGASGEIDSAMLLRRSKGEADGEDTGQRVFSIGQCPKEVLFITAAVDVGHHKFDVSFRGWDLENRSWWLDRHTIRQRVWDDGVMRDLSTKDRIEDWDVLIEQVIDRRFPIIGYNGLTMPVAAIAIDSGDGNVTEKAREFARRMLRRGKFWGSPNNPWARVRLVKGAKSANAPELPDKPRKTSVDEMGRPVSPTILEYDLGVHKLKEQAIERLGVNDGGPGQCYFAEGIAANHFEEYFGEKLIDNQWIRNGPNESLDCFAYEEAVRLMLKPDRKDIKWDDGKRPPWATPIPANVEGGGLAVDGEVQVVKAPSPTTPKKSFFERMEALNNQPETEQ